MTTETVTKSTGTILDKIAEHARERVRLAKEQLSEADIRRMAESLPKRSGRFLQALSGSKLSFICERRLRRSFHLQQLQTSTFHSSQLQQKVQSTLI